MKKTFNEIIYYDTGNFKDNYIGFYFENIKIIKILHYISNYIIEK